MGSATRVETTNPKGYITSSVIPAESSTDHALRRH